MNASNSFVRGGFTRTEDELPDRNAIQRAPQIDDIFPDLWVDSTQGSLQLHDWARGRHTVFFAHPSAYTPTSEDDVMDFARNQSAFDQRGCRILGMSQSDPATESMWIEEISARHGIDVQFPIISDEDGRIAGVLGMYNETSRFELPVGKTFVISPEMKIRAILEFPIVVSRSAEEILRIVDALIRAQR